MLATSRDPSVGFGTAAKPHHVEPFGREEATSTLLTLVGARNPSTAERISAATIAESLGGLPLAMAQISGFIVQQRLSMGDFIPLYERNASKINKRSMSRGSDDQNLATIWEVALASLPGSSGTLQALLAFLDPDRVHESILLEGGPALDTSKFEFLADEMEYVQPSPTSLRFTR